jgi:hypothetical protein
LSRRQVNGLPRAILAPALTDPHAAQLAESLRAAGEIVVERLAADDAVEGFDFDRELTLVAGRWQVVARSEK